MKKIFVSIITCTLLAACGGQKPEATPSSNTAEAEEEVYVDTLAANHPEYLPEIPLDTIAPNFSAPDTLGQVISLSDYAGKYVVVDFWATWCIDCRMEIPELKRVFDEFKEQKIKGADIQFISYSFDRDAEKWKETLRKEQFAWPQISTLEPKWHDIPATQAYGLHWIPAFLLISPDGHLAGKAISAKGLRQLLKDAAK